MYIKIVPEVVLGQQEVITEVKCFKRHVKLDPISSEPVLVLDLDGDIREYGETRDVTIYVMNDSGKTIDRIVWNDEVRCSD